ncbi:DNA methyltransferase [Gordonia sp. KTR9]|uniref:DNA methyltransferase n=1 Tax=Gordonia sp. KTR9 TaxID=337191 RepID=UPI00027DE6D0|nr:DNA methyltransferase [Gordonia sp. KTR9]AFR51574.1 Type II restriction enzyme, methylase subunits [Gordonia sp. KTR9]
MSATGVDRGEVLRRLRDFATHWSGTVAEWTSTAAPHTEKSYAQSFWSDLLGCFGINASRRDLFERDAVRATTGRGGYIDVFQSGVFIGEAKSVGADLVKAHDQALDYLAGGSIGQHEFPKYVLVTDFARIRIDRLGDESWSVEFPVGQSPEHLDELLFLAGHETVTRAEEQDASIHAARLMAGLYAAMVGDDADAPVADGAAHNPDEEDAAVQHASMFLTRILFLLYGDDAGLWEADLFYRWVDQTTTADTLGGQLVTLFQVLNTPAERRPRTLPDLIARFPFVNGALFLDTMPADFFTHDMREALLAACRFRWTRISPAIFGAMFQLVKSREARRTAGEHYTTEDNILKTIGPLFLDTYRARADRLIANKSTSAAQLAAFQDELASNIYVDPACGSGNFLNVAYAKLREIETDIIVERRRRLGETGMSLDATLEQKLTIDRFHGFEINWWPAKIAETAMFLVDHQANRNLAEAIGQAPERLPITITAHITHADALDLDWKAQLPAVAGQTFVFGNPPFLGHATRTDDQAEQLRRAWGTRDISRLDYVTAWHAKTLDLLAQRPGAFAFVTTNSIVQGDQVPRLFGPITANGWRIAFAHRTFAWDSQAPGKAAVHCVIVGFTKDLTVKQRLFTYPSPKADPDPVQVTTDINAYLVDAPAVLITKRNRPLSPEIVPAVFGNMARDEGNLIVENDDYPSVIADPVAAQYVRPFIGSRELLHNLPRWCLWLVDMDPADVKRSPILKERLEKVALMRSRSKAASTRAMASTPHLFGQRSHRDVPHLCLPKVCSETRPYYIAAAIGPTTIASDLTFTIEDTDGLQFALVSSAMFIAWQKAIGGRLESRVRFANTLTWNTFPVPALTSATRAKIIAAGRGVLAARALHPNRSLAEAYNPLAMDPELLKAHHRLDKEVDTALGASRRLNNERQRLELLFELYRNLSADA